MDSVTSCWKCYTPLTASAAQLVPPAQAMPGAPAERPGAYVPVTSNAGDPAVATRAAILLALVIPFIGLPAGWIFMMIEDKRLQRVGRICVQWSLIGLLFHVVLTGIMMKSAAEGLLKYGLPMMKNMAPGGSSAGGGIPSEGP